MGTAFLLKATLKIQLRNRQEVAAICYRLRNRKVEFLLVRTRGGRWIFPKGGVEPGLTHAQSAALEAVEEAGAHGRIETTPFTRYLRHRAAVAVAAYLCEVSRLEAPQESNRNPSWFRTEKAKQRLLKDRPPEFGAELARVVDRAVARIHRLYGEVHQTHRPTPKEALQAVSFEAFETRYSRAVTSPRYLPPPEIQEHARSDRQLGLGTNIRSRVLQLGDGGVFSPDKPRKVTTIDSRVRAKSPKARLLPSTARQAEHKPKASNERTEPH
jgi:8-oxo-dGTP pyrophosphatase MutT (NUDIX family)